MKKIRIVYKHKNFVECTEKSVDLIAECCHHFQCICDIFSYSTYNVNKPKRQVVTVWPPHIQTHSDWWNNEYHKLTWHAPIHAACVYFSHADNWINKKQNTDIPSVCIVAKSNRIIRTRFSILYQEKQLTYIYRHTKTEVAVASARKSQFLCQRI